MSVNLFSRSQGKTARAIPQGLTTRASVFFLFPAKLGHSTRPMLPRDIYYLLQECKKLVMITCLLAMGAGLYIYI